MTATTRIEAANANHLICSRSSPLERRIRTIREAAENSPSTNITRIPAIWRLYASLKASEAAAGADSPMFTRMGPRIGQAVIAIGTTRRTRSASASQATGRQRRDGSLPSGNRSKRNVKTRRIPGGHAQTATHDMKAPNGSAPGSLASA